MHPWLLTWGDHAIGAYFACISLGLTFATFVVRREARREGLSTRDIFDVALVVVPAGALGARLLVVLDDPDRYFDQPLLLLSGGWTSYGGFLGLLVGITAVARFKGMDPWRVVDVFAPAVLFGHAFARMGCLASGCCHGRPADWPLGVEVPWSVRYLVPERVPESLLVVPLHPSPLYEALLALGLFVAVTRLRARKRYHGQAFVGMLAGYGVGRFVLEWFRGDLERGFVAGGLSVGQTMTTGFVLSAVVLHLLRRSSSCTPS